MTKSPQTISVNANIIELKRLMNRRSIRHVPVTQQGALVGIVSERDVSLAASMFKGRSFNEEVLVRDICLYDPVIVESDTALTKVLDLMAKKKIGSVLVTEHGKLAGILTTVDICRAFSAELKK